MREDVGALAGDVGGPRGISDVASGGEEQPKTVEIEGRLDRVKFAGRDNWVVGVLWTGKERVTFKGTLPDGVAEGDEVKLSGIWMDDPKWGKQFDAKSAAVAIPTKVVGIKKWLVKFIDGIGERGAELLVDRFGVDAPAVLEARADSGADPLLDLPGFDAEKAARARASYAALGKNPEMSRWLAEHGVVGAFAGRLVAHYKGETRAVLEADPYKPMFDVDGFGFKRSDELGKNLGVADSDPRRARAAVLFAFDEQAANGHVWLSSDELAMALAKDFSVPVDSTREATERLLADGLVVLEGTSVPRLYKTSMRDAEVSACFDILRLIRAAAELPHVEWVVDDRLNEEQQQAVLAACASGVVAITGRPGSGKSHTLKAICKALDPGGISTLLMAPTGKAAKRMSQATGMEAKTIHRGLEFGPPRDEDGNAIGGRMGFQRNRERRLAQRLVIVDEASMLDTELAAALLSAVQDGARLILVGDVDQLPSVGPGTVLKDLLECGLFPVARLERNMRSAEGGAIAVAAAKIIRGERLDDGDLAGDVRFLEVENAETAAKEIVRLVGGGDGAITGYDLREQVQVLCPKRIGPLGAEVLNSLVQAAANPKRAGEPELEQWEEKFRLRDKVIVTKNCYELDVFNGDTGFVAAIEGDAKKPRLVVALDGREVVFEKEHLKIVHLAYAISVHKSQGSEYPAVIIPVHSCDGRMLQRNLLYTALTRAREKVWLVGDRKGLQRAIRNVDMTTRNTSLWARVRHLAQTSAREGAT